MTQPRQPKRRAVIEHPNPLQPRPDGRRTLCSIRLRGVTQEVYEPLVAAFKRLRLYHAPNTFPNSPREHAYYVILPYPPSSLGMHFRGSVYYVVARTTFFSDFGYGVVLDPREFLDQEHLWEMSLA
jgi:hypothetical protein